MIPTPGPEERRQMERLVKARAGLGMVAPRPATTLAPGLRDIREQRRLQAVADTLRQKEIETLALRDTISARDEEIRSLKRQLEAARTKAMTERHNRYHHLSLVAELQRQLEKYAEDRLRDLGDEMAASDIIILVSKRTGVSIPEIKSPRRNRAAVAARHEVFYLLRKHTTLSLPSIGRMVGHRDHTTVMHGIKKHMQRSGIEA